MSEKLSYPASVLDELVVLAEEVTNTSFTQGWTFSLEGAVNSESLRKALDDCLNLHPKFKCVLVTHYPSLKSWFRYHWECRPHISSSDILEEIDNSTSLETERETIDYYRDLYSSHCIDITREPGLKVVLIKDVRRVHLIFFVHHAASDGIGFFSFMQGFIKLYEEIVYYGKRGSDHLPDYASISSPEVKLRLKYFSWRYLSPFLEQSALLRREPPSQLHSRQQEKILSKALFCMREIPPRTFSALRATAKRHQVSINDYLLAAMFQTVKKWKKQQGDYSERIYITVPVNLRSPGDRTVGNIVSALNISFIPERIAEGEEFTRLVQEEIRTMRGIKIAETTLNFAYLLKCGSIKLVKHWMKSNYHKSHPTLNLSNLGLSTPNQNHIDQEGFNYLGSARISNMSCIGIAPPWLQLVVLTYNNRMVITLSVAHPSLSLETYEEFLDAFILELTQ